MTLYTGQGSQRVSVDTTLEIIGGIKRQES